MNYRRTCNNCALRWTIEDRTPGRCPQCQSPSYRSRPALGRGDDVVLVLSGDDPDRTVGWHPDPTERFPMRWWDGLEWSGKVLINGTEAVDTNPMGLFGTWEKPTVAGAARH